MSCFSLTRGSGRCYVVGGPRLMQMQDGNPLHRPLRPHPQTPVRPVADARGSGGGEGEAGAAGSGKVA
jgi:hypothetical protein